MKTFYLFIFLLVATVLLRAQEMKGPLKQGLFAAYLDYVISSPTNQSLIDWRKRKFTSEEIQTAVDRMEERGLIPFGGWRLSETVHLHEMTSLIVILNKGEKEIDLSNPTLCLNYAIAHGCDPRGELGHYLTYFRKNKGSSNKAEERDTAR